jgi:hypothetical protein
LGRVRKTSKRTMFLRKGTNLEGNQSATNL